MKKRLIGTVTSDKMNKSRRVEIERKFRHARYGKIVRGRTVCHVHDEGNASKQGDLVEIIESRPRSKLKRWDLVRVVQQAGEGFELPSERGGAAEAAAAAAAGTQTEQTETES
jgi:small subunit ribosomal protein S17